MTWFANLQQTPLIVQTTYWRSEAKLTTREWLDNQQFD